MAGAEASAHIQRRDDRTVLSHISTFFRFFLPLNRESLFSPRFVLSTHTFFPSPVPFLFSLLLTLFITISPYKTKRGGKKGKESAEKTTKRMFSCVCRERTVDPLLFSTLCVTRFGSWIEGVVCDTCDSIVCSSEWGKRCSEGNKNDVKDRTAIFPSLLAYSLWREKEVGNESRKQNRFWPLDLHTKSRQVPAVHVILSRLQLSAGFHDYGPIHRD